MISRVVFESAIRSIVRTMLLESQSAFKRVEDLNPGDVFVLPEDSATKFAVQRVETAAVPEERHGGNWIKYEDSEWVGRVDSDYDVSKIQWSRPAGIAALVGVRVRVYRPGKKSKDLSVRFEYDEGPDADEINKDLRSMSKGSRIVPLGISSVEVVGVDEDFVVKPRTAPKVSKTKLIMHVLYDADEPLSKDEILKRVAKLEGKPYVPTSNGSYFAPSNEKSVVTLGLVNVIKHGRTVLYEPKHKVEKFDWRPDETIPEDYYAL